MPDASFSYTPLLREVVAALQEKPNLSPPLHGISSEQPDLPGIPDPPSQQPDLPGIPDSSSLVRFVGGAVRNALLGLPSKDVDLATLLSPQEVTKRLEACGLRVIPTGLAHGTVRVVGGERRSSDEQDDKGDSESYEITTLRRDVATDGRHARVAFTDDWAEDALRRDFTVNALSFDPITSEGWDYVGGLADLRAYRLRFIGVPAERIVEDYLRILRLFRFVAQYPRFVAEQAGLRACCEHQEGLSRLSGERIASELLLLLGGKDPCGALRLMEKWGVCAVAGWRHSEAVLSALERMLAFEREVGGEDAPRRLLFLIASAEGDENFKKRLTNRLVFATTLRKRVISLLQLKCAGASL